MSGRECKRCLLDEQTCLCGGCWSEWDDHPPTLLDHALACAAFLVVWAVVWALFLFGTA